MQMPAYPRPEEGRHAYVRLDFNENTSGFPSAYPQNIPHQSISAYPEYGALVERIARFYDVPGDWLMLTNGSDEGLFVTAHTFIEPGEDAAVVSRPCFVVIPHCLKLAGAEVIDVPVLPDLSFDLAGIERALKKGVKVAMFATPENPTGAVLAVETIRNWCREFPDTLFAIDEAYGEFADSSMLGDIAKFDNLLVVKTFSKAWGMAGLRLGMVFGNPKLLEYMHVVRMPYTVNSAAVWTAAQLLDRHAEVKAAVARVIEEKARLAGALAERGIKIDLGKANSVLVHAGINAQPLTDFCRKQGVLVRNRSSDRFQPGTNGHRSATWGKVRVSIGTSEETDRFLAAVDRFNSSYALMFDLDGTIVDITNSYDPVVHELVHRHSGTPLPPEELRLLRAEGGFNDDWEAVVEILKRRGFKVPLQEIAREGLALYLSSAKGKEPLLVELATLQRLGGRYPLFVVTGRTRAEYDPLWAGELNSIFKRVLCLHDLPGKRAKPSPDYLAHLLEEFNLAGGVYVGNAVDDMQAARAAGLDAIGITTTHPADVLLSAGAHLTVSSVEALTEVFMI
jgi:histidinol-phosphate aminotransferase